MFSSSLVALLKLSKTTSPLKLFPFDCITLYITKNFMIEIENFRILIWVAYGFVHREVVRLYSRVSH